MEPSAQVEHQEKHVVINESIGLVNGAIDRLNGLVCRVREGSSAQPSKGEDTTAPTLLGTLDNTPCELNGAAKRIDNCVSELQELLF